MIVFSLNKSILCCSIFNQAGILCGRFWNLMRHPCRIRVVSSLRHLMGNIAWHEVEKPNWRRWEKAFTVEDFSSPLGTLCPICSEASLFQWYRLDDSAEKTIGARTFSGRGFNWQWCSSCGSYRLLSCLVPKIWLGISAQKEPPVELYNLSKPFTERAS